MNSLFAGEIVWPQVAGKEAPSLTSAHSRQRYQPGDDNAGAANVLLPYLVDVYKVARRLAAASRRQRSRATSPMIGLPKRTAALTCVGKLAAVEYICATGSETVLARKDHRRPSHSYRETMALRGAARI
jgi:hypothetical protein